VKIASGEKGETGVDEYLAETREGHWGTNGLLERGLLCKGADERRRLKGGEGGTGGGVRGMRKKNDEGVGEWAKGRTFGMG